MMSMSPARSSSRTSSAMEAICSVRRYTMSIVRSSSVSRTSAMRSGCLSLRHQFVVDEQVGGIGHADGEAVLVLLQHQRAEAARQRLGQQAHGGLVQRELLEIDEGNLQVARERVVELLLLRLCLDP